VCPVIRKKASEKKEANAKQGKAGSEVTVRERVKCIYYRE
jgi:hypothetical protein